MYASLLQNTPHTVPWSAITPGLPANIKKVFFMLPKDLWPVRVRTMHNQWRVCYWDLSNRVFGSCRFWGGFFCVLSLRLTDAMRSLYTGTWWLCHILWALKISRLNYLLDINWIQQYDLMIIPVHIMSVLCISKIHLSRYHY